MGKKVVGARLSMTAISWIDGLMKEYDCARSEVVKVALYVGRENEDRMRKILKDAQEIKSNGVVEREQ